MIDQIRKHPQLKHCFVDTCSEHGATAFLSNSINELDVVIINSDKYYRDYVEGNNLPSVDCIVVIKCSVKSYAIHAVELKSSSRGKHLDLNQIENKFTCFTQHFCNRIIDDYIARNAVKFNLVLVGVLNRKSIDYGLNIRRLMSRRFELANKKYTIRYVPTPHEIKPCYK